MTGIVRQLAKRLPLLAGFVLIAAVSLLTASPPVARAAALGVNDFGDANDSIPGDGSCKTLAGVCTLRAAIQESNALAGTDTVTFLLGAGTPTIKPLAQLPTITDSVIITGTSGGATRIELDGTLASGCSRGLLIASGSVNVSGLVINRWCGEGIYSVSTGLLTVTNSYIGTDATGAAAAANLNGIRVDAGTAIIGTPGAGNVISGNTGSGILALTGTASLTVQSSRIGTNAAGSAALPNAIGIASNATSNTVGGFAAGNVISGNLGVGVQIIGVGVSGSIRSNLIGTDATGMTAIPNNTAGGIAGGVYASSASVNIGDGTTGNRNVISGNMGRAIYLFKANSSIVSRNFIGTTVTGTPLGNTSDGMLIDTTDFVQTDSNLIGNNGGDGVSVVGGGKGNFITTNQIYDNGGLGIDLDASGVTPNDSGDADPGSNNLQNFPVLVSAATNGTNTYLVGSLNSTPSSTFSIDIYGNLSCDASGFGEGGQWGASTNVNTDAAGNASFLLVGPAVTPGTVITATATLVSFAGFDTSEFSNCVTAVPCAGGDPDCDGYLDVAPALHQAPKNTNVNFDNCPGLYNPDQLNLDGNLVDIAPPKGADDLTLAMSDAKGDACDTDADNDGLDASSEAAGCNGSGPLNPLVADSDLDKFVDGAECALGTNPGDLTSRPSAVACGAATDADLDGIIARNEFCFYGTSDASSNSDGDVCADAKEVASLNGDTNVTASDLSLVAQNFVTSYGFPSYVYFSDFDMNKDGAIGAIDLSFVAQRFGIC